MAISLSTGPEGGRGLGWWGVLVGCGDLVGLVLGWLGVIRGPEDFREKVLTVGVFSLSLLLSEATTAERNQNQKK